MRFPAKKNAGCPKAPRDFPPRKDDILYPPSGCLGTPLPLPQSLCGRTYVRTYVRTDGHVTITSQSKFLGSIGYQICLAMELHYYLRGSDSYCLITFCLMPGPLRRSIVYRTQPTYQQPHNFSKCPTLTHNLLNNLVCGCEQIPLFLAERG